MAHAFGSLDELGKGYGFRKIRHALGVMDVGEKRQRFRTTGGGPG